MLALWLVEAKPLPMRKRCTYGPWPRRDASCALINVSNAEVTFAAAEIIICFMSESHELSSVLIRCEGATNKYGRNRATRIPLRKLSVRVESFEGAYLRLVDLRAECSQLQTLVRRSHILRDLWRSLLLDQH